MKLQILICTAVTLAIAGILYECRPITFAVWTNAALINHSHPLLIVSFLEGAILLVIFAAALAISYLLRGG